MTIPLTDTLGTLGTYPIAKDTEMLAGYRSVADIAARDAIPIEGVESIASQRKKGMLVYVQSDGNTYRLGTGLTNTDWEIAYSSGAALDVYLSGLNGNDANDGLTPGTAVQTFSRVWELLPQVVLGPFVVHIGDHGGAGYSYELPPDSCTFAQGAFIVLYGDGAGQGGEDGFNEIAAGIAGAATTSTVLELAVNPGDDAVRGYTVQYTSGAASGCRRMVRNNVGVLATLVDNTSSDTAVLTPVPGDNYRVLEPAALLLLPEVNTTGYFGVNISLTYLANRAPVHLVNIKLDASGAFPFFGRHLTVEPKTVFFGVLVADPTNLSIAASSPIIAGLSDPIYLETWLVYAAIGHAHVGGDWQGWGLAWETTVSSKNCLIDFFDSVRDLGFQGFIVAGELTFISNAPITIRGGSAWRISQTDSDITLTLRSLLGTAVPFKLGSVAGVPAANIWTAKNSSLTIVDAAIPTYIEAVSSSVIGNVFVMENSELRGVADISIAAGSMTSGTVIQMSRSTINAEGVIDVDSTGSTNHSILAATRSQILIDELVFNSALNGVFLADSSTMVFRIAGITGISAANTVLDIRDSSAHIDSGPITGLINQVGGICDLGSADVVGDDPAAVVVVGSGGRFLAGSITNNNAGGDSIRLSGGASAFFNNLTSMTAAAYCINAQFGGRVFFTGAPTPANFTSGTADFIVDGVTTAAAAALAASGSSVVSVDGLGSVSRAD